MPLDQIKQQFPILNQSGNPLVYLDSAASSQKPQVVIDRMTQFYTKENANVHRGVYELSEMATAAYEGARKGLQHFIGAKSHREVIFTKGTTEAINLVAQTWGQTHLQQGDEILCTICEHHSNIVPWQLVAAARGAKVRFLPLDEDLRLDLTKLDDYITEKTRMVAIGHVSNVLGIIHPLEKIITKARQVGAKVLIDGAQGVPHLTVDVQALDCDFYAFSGHKMLGPTGIGVLYGREDLLQSIPPYQGGGDMIASVSVSGSTWNELPYKFEAGTPPIAAAVGLAAAVEFLQSIDRQAALAHERHLGSLVIDEMKDHPRLRFFQPRQDDWVGIVTFHHESIHPHDLAAICDSYHICIRAGHHCAQPLMAALGVPSTSRVSPYLYNDENDILAFIKALRAAEKMFI